MTKSEKQELIYYAKKGYDFKRLRKLLNCSDSAIRKYIKVFSNIV